MEEKVENMERNATIKRCPYPYPFISFFLLGTELMQKKMFALLEEASADKFMRLLNRFGKWIIPFNRPHRLRVLELDDAHCKTMIPYRRLNWNHLKGVHAAAIVTIGEFTAGVLLLWNFGVSKYRLILSRLEVEYHYQGKTHLNAVALFDVSQKEKYLQSLQEGEAVRIEMQTEIKDLQDNLVATVRTSWQLKPWKAVQTKV